jgi:exopolyphosphatase / guanosine-5'-triphosphate,3'-diphosphate pyrophosphatase
LWLRPVTNYHSGRHLSVRLPTSIRFDSDRARSGELEPIAVVDIGSNSVRLVVYEGAVRAPTALFNEKVLAGLGRSIASTGSLDEAAVARTLQGLMRFSAILRILGVKNVRAIATAACREASNGAQFIARAEKALCTRIDVLSGQQEAELAANGVQMGFENPDGIAGDLGGGSLELIDLSGKLVRHATTLPLGSLRLMDASGGRIEKALALSDDEMARVPWIEQGAGRSFYAVGGTWRAFAKLHMAARAYPLHMMQGYALSTAETIDFCEQIRKSKKLAGIAAGHTVSKSRRDVLPYGTVVLERLLRKMKPREVVFSAFGVREGLVYKLLSKAEQERDPLIAFATDYAMLRSRSFKHSQELCTWTDALFAAGGPTETPAERRLRHAACLLSDVAWRAHPDYRGEQSLAGVAYAAMAGIDHTGRVFLAMASYFRHAGPGGKTDEVAELSSQLAPLLPNRLLERAKIVGAAVRAAHMLSIARPGIIDEIPMRYEKDRLVVVIPGSYAALNGDRVQRRFATLAALLGKTADVRTSG